MRVRYINSQNYSVDFVDANILPTSAIFIKENGILQLKMTVLV